jgi:hypothetical protein
MVEKELKRTGTTWQCANKECGYKQPAPNAAQAEGAAPPEHANGASSGSSDPDSSTPAPHLASAAGKDPSEGRAVHPRRRVI